MTDLHDSVNPKGNRTGRPEEHHQARQSICFLPSPIVPYLRDQLDAPEDGTDGAEDIGGHGDIALRRHCCAVEAILRNEKRDLRLGRIGRKDQQRSTGNQDTR